MSEPTPSEPRGLSPGFWFVSKPRGFPPRLWFFLHLLVFVTFLSLWTWKLLEAHPVPESVRGGLGSARVAFAAAKSLHLGSYLFLTILGASLSRHWRWWVVAFLMLHAIGTEIGQTLVPNRTGTVADVLIDWAGIALGVLAVRVWNQSGET